MNNLKEGVFIVEPDTSHVLFTNSAAKRFNISLNENFSLSLTTDENGEVTNMNSALFAQIDLGLFKDPNINSVTVT